MKNLIILSVIVISFSACMSKPSDYPLQEYAKWSPDDHYFRATLMQWHYITEAKSADILPKIYAQKVEQNNIPTSADQIADGEYSASSPYDAYDFCHTINLTVKESKIVKVTYDEVHRDGHSKKMDVAYGEKMKTFGTTPFEAYEEMQLQLIGTQNFQEVDGVSGATYSKFRFRYAGYLALMKAKMSR